MPRLALSAACLAAVLSLAAGCDSDPVRRVGVSELTRLANEPGTQLQYMGSDGIYHYIDRPDTSEAGHVSYRVPRNYLKLERTFPRGEGVRYPVDAAMIESGATVEIIPIDPEPESTPEPESEDESTP